MCWLTPKQHLKNKENRFWVNKKCFNGIFLLTKYFNFDKLFAMRRCLPSKSMQRCQSGPTPKIWTFLGTPRITFDRSHFEDYAEVSERSNVHAWKACVVNSHLGFESRPLRHIAGTTKKLTRARHSANLDFLVFPANPFPPRSPCLGTRHRWICVRKFSWTGTAFASWKFVSKIMSKHIFSVAAYLIFVCGNQKINEGTPLADRYFSLVENLLLWYRGWDR